MKALADASAPRYLWTPDVQRFFSGCNPVTASNIITALAAGTTIEVAFLPWDAIPAVLLLATIGVREHNQQIVDDFVYLYQRQHEAFELMAGRSKDDAEGLHEYDPNAVQLTHRDCWHPEMALVSMLDIGGPRAEYRLNEVPEAGYMYAVYEELVNAELSSLFKQQG